MSKPISRGLIDLINHLKSTLELTDVMEQAGVEFTSKNRETWKARCFMHEDTSPSISVTVSKGMFNCFSTGCEARGDVVNFWRLWNNLDTLSACKSLAREHGIDANAYLKLEADPADKLHAFMRQFTSRLHANLLKNPAALEYVRKRGVSDEVISKFQLGYSPIAGGHAGLTSAEYKVLGLYRDDMYKHTLVFPVVDPSTGKLFHYARPLNHTDGPKYVGSSSSHPGRWRGPVFGLNVARRATAGKSNRHLVFVEGFFDVLALHSAGINNSVCGMGSHITREQFETVKAHNIQRVTVLFDGDRAGQEGAKKISKMDRPQVRLDVAFLPEGDPDEFLLKYGSDALRAVINESLSPIELVMVELKDALESGGFYTKADAIRQVMVGLSKLPVDEQAVAMQKLHEVCQVPISSMWDLLAESERVNKETIESERQILAAAMHRKEDHVLISSRIRDVNKSFLLKAHENFWLKITGLYEKGATEITSELLEDFDTVIPDLMSSISLRNGANLEYHLDVIKDATCRRALEVAAKKLLAESKNESKDVSDMVSEHLSTVSIELSPDLKAEFSAPEQVDLAMAYIHERMEKGGMPGITLGRKWKGLNVTTLGFQPSYVYLLAASAKAGKTAMAQNWALECAVKQQVPTLWVNLEMSEQDLAIRNLSIISGLPNSSLRVGAFNAAEKQVLDNAAAMYHSSPFFVVNAAGFTIQEVINTMRKYVHTKGVRIVFLDYIQLIRVGGAKREYWEAHMEVSTALKNAVSRDLKVPLIAVSQLNRYASQEGTSGGANIAGSYKYIQDCDCYMGLRARTMKEVEMGVAGNTVLHVEYNRHGPQDIEINLDFNKQTLRMEEVH